MRLFITLVLVTVCLCTRCVTQIVVQPICSFEKLTWGDSLESVKRQLAGKTSVGVRDTINREHIRTYSYRDTVDSKEIGVDLNFTDEGRRLSTIMLFYFGASEGPATADSIRSRNVGELWDWFTAHYGSMHVDRDATSFGQTRVWRFWQSTVQMINVHGPAALLTVIYSQQGIN